MVFDPLYGCILFTCFYCSLIRYVEAVQIHQGPGSLPDGELLVGVKCEAKYHDVRIICGNGFFRWKECAAYLAHELNFGTVVDVKILRGSATAETVRLSGYGIHRVFGQAWVYCHRGFSGIHVRDAYSPFLDRVDLREFISPGFLLFGRVYIIKSLLFRMDVSANKAQKPAILAMEFIDKWNKVKYNVHEQ